jgi:PEGA domain
MTSSLIRHSTGAVAALSLIIWSAAPALAQHRGGSHGGGHAGGGHSGGSRSAGGFSSARSAPSGSRAAAPMTRSYAARSAPRGSTSAVTVSRGANGYGYASPRGGPAYAGTRGVAVAGNRGVAVAGPRGVAVAGPRGVAVASTRYGGAYYGGRYYGGYHGYGYHYVAPVHYVAPYYHFRPWYSIGFGITIGYPVAWSYPYYYPAYYPYAYPYPYPYPSAAAPYAVAPSTTYSTNDGMYPETGAAYPSQGPTGTNGSAYPSTHQTGATGSVSVQQTRNEQNSGGVSFEITPANAELFVDGADVGTISQFTPQSQPLGLSAGPHRLEIRAPGYQPLNIDAEIISGEVIPYQGTMQRQ